jgi:hypothetical protein
MVRQPRRNHERLTRARPPVRLDDPPGEEIDREEAEGGAAGTDRKGPKGRPAVESDDVDEPLPSRAPWLPPARR